MEPLSQTVLRQMSYAVCEYLGEGQFLLMCDPPGWFREVWGASTGAGMQLRLGDGAPFLDGFLIDAEPFWATGSKGRYSSGLWVQQTIDRLEIPMEALALCTAGKSILLIHSSQTEFQERTRVLQVARDSVLVHEQLVKETQKKEILLHCIIHDLSQPLAAMRGCLEILELENGTSKMKELVATGKQQAERQESMIRDVLKAFSEDLKGDGAGEQTAGLNPSLLECAAATVAAFGAAFEANGAAIRLDPSVDRSVPWIVKGDKSRLMRIFSNLVENALRYSPANSIVTIGMEEDGSYVKVVIDDQGPGLPKEFRPWEAFKLFSKGKSGGGKAGLGLYFCKVTVERWGGAIGCESLPQRGSRFWFRLPKAQSLRKDASPSANSDRQIVRAVVPVSPEVTAPGQIHRDHSEYSSSSGRDETELKESLQILLAEDDEVIREITKELLLRQGHKVVAVADGLTALSEWSTHQFDVLLVDDEMPGAGGTEVARRIRTEEQSTGRHQRILSLTGNNTKEDEKRMLDAGVDACLGKPFHTEDLYRALRVRSVATPAASSDSAGAFDPELLARVGGDAKLLRRMIITFLKDCPKKMARIKKAVERQDASELASAAHALKGLVAIFGAESARQHAQQLEGMGRKNSLSAAGETFLQLNEEIANLEQKLRGYVTQDNRDLSKPRKWSGDA